MFNFWNGKQIVVTGGDGFLGRHLVNELRKKGAKKIFIPRHSDHDLRYEKVCLKVTQNSQIVFHLAGNVGGIGYNQTNPASLFYDNIIMGVNLIEACRKNLVAKTVIVGTVCSYPKNTPVPFKEETLWDGYPEETNAPYGIAKKALIVQAQAYSQQYSMNILNLLPVNLYGPGDNFDPVSSHVIPALITKFVEAKKNNSKSVTLWGSGKATREFLYVEDAAKALVASAEFFNRPDPINIGVGSEISIRDLAETIQRLVSYEGKIVWDTTKPDGQPRRMLDTFKAKQFFSFSASTNFQEGLEKTIDWYEKNI